MVVRRDTLTEVLLLALILLSTPPGLRAQAPGSGQGSPEPAQEETADAEYGHESAARARAVRAQTEIDLDGRLDEPVWAEAPAITDFLQEDPAEGEPGTERTEFRVAYDDDAIYIGAMLYDSAPITTRLTRRDTGSGDYDYITVSLDSFHDHETVYQFSVNPSGAIRDAVSSSGGGRGGGDSSWDPVWEVATRITGLGWSAEMRIPFSQLRFSPDEEQVWGIEIKRNIHRNQETVAFPFIPTLERGGASRFTHLDGIEGIEPGRRLELLPYVAARGEYLQLGGSLGHHLLEPLSKRIRLLRSGRPGPEIPVGVQRDVGRHSEPRFRPGGGGSLRHQPDGVRDPASRSVVRSSWRVEISSGLEKGARAGARGGLRSRSTPAGLDDLRRAPPQLRPCSPMWPLPRPSWAPQRSRGG